MDSLTRDVERIFNQNRDENEKNGYEKKSVVCSAMEYMFDAAALMMIYVVMIPVFLMTVTVVLLGKAGAAFLRIRTEKENRN